MSLTISGQGSVWISACPKLARSFATARCTYVRDAKKIGVEAVHPEQSGKGEHKGDDLEDVKSGDEEDEQHMGEGTSTPRELMVLSPGNRIIEHQATHLVRHWPMRTSSRWPTEFGPEVVDVSLE